ncbi:spermidine synthase [Methylobacterium sp. Leaf108]|uniref:spermidine synthase n=1 Tax=Methylobacterium sp. Leaf108 TaxID=1736256 RepID=UPI0006F7F48E|nr:spermidine synthase [Methylobacterium sp. Leaf108]KQP58183.1 spermidine synthase [Methylobacterium sp. Leaf108]
MKPWVLLDTAAIPGSTEVLRLLQRGSEFSIQLGHNELMNSRLSGSEEALADLACARIGARAGARLLVGGLGMGFTLAAALAALRPDAEVVVAELVPQVVAWARGPLAAICGPGPDDPRVRLRQDDVARVIRERPLAYDAILLDVDNGPDGLTRPANDRLYDGEGLAAALAALRPGGVLAVWSAAPDGSFTQRLRRIGFAVEEVGVRANGKGGGARHTIWLATRPLRATSSARRPA